MQPRSGAPRPHRFADRGRARVAAAGAVLALAALAGCSAGEGGSADASPSAEVVLPGATPTGGAEQAALDAYTAMWDATVAASHEGGGSTGDLDRYATGAAYSLLNEALRSAAESEVTGEPVLAPEVTVEDGDHAKVTDCLDDSAWNLGAGPSQSGAGPRRVEAALVHDGLAWRVSELRIWEPGTC
ncbi:hypothetical protein LG943_17770 [Streptomonospora sp. S1-112]|uniref:Secreted protein/lipoprotein n=1 Tax=Streptomonospora mangrovi TaxID=2883123 RepID=A0A9X3NLV8_9ACTN|nr:hypothetical protein [Streptomonospora mangrovi]MDA0566149.1 hypothetical protein [Streptomonospora mangrovi]